MVSNYGNSASRGRSRPNASELASAAVDQHRGYTPTDTEAATVFDDEDDAWITVICEAKGTGRTVGIAAYQPSTSVCILTQLTDSQTYVKTNHTLTVRWPSMIGVIATGGMANHTSASIVDPSTQGQKFEETLLIRSLTKHFGGSRSNNNSTNHHGDAATDTVDSEGVPFIAVQRRFFDASAGMDFVRQLIVQDDETASHLYAESTAVAHVTYWML